jgi:hypothetical protein
MDTCPSCHSPLKVAPDFVVGIDYAWSIYPATMACLECLVLWGRMDGGGLVSVFPAEDAYSTS